MLAVVEHQYTGGGQEYKHIDMWHVQELHTGLSLCRGDVCGSEALLLSFELAVTSHFLSIPASPDSTSCTARIQHYTTGLVDH